MNILKVQPKQALLGKVRFRWQIPTVLPNILRPQPVDPDSIQ